MQIIQKYMLPFVQFFPFYSGAENLLDFMRKGWYNIIRQPGKRRVFGIFLPQEAALAARRVPEIIPYAAVSKWL